MEANPSNEELKAYVGYAVETGDPFALSIVENLARYPVTIREFIVGDSYLGLKNVYPAVILALEEVYHPRVEGMDCALRFGTDYREVLLTGGIGCAKTYASVLGMLYGVYLLTCLRSPHALFGLDPNSEIVFLIQSIRQREKSSKGVIFLTSTFPEILMCALRYSFRTILWFDRSLASLQLRLV
jgi:hypothetical protein